MAKCENCGAEIAEDEPRCSHCGTFQYPGAEKEYWDKIHQVHEDLKDLEEVPREAYEKEIKRHARTLGRRMGIGVAALAVVIGGRMIWSHYTEKREQKEQKAQLVWQNENFPQLDEWYAQGDYDAILEFEQELYEKDSSYHIWNWEHAEFLAGYEEYCRGKEAGRILKSEPDQKDRDYWLEELIFQTMSLKWRLDSGDLRVYTKEEKALLRDYQKETWELTGEILALADGKMEELWSELSGDGGVSYRACQEYVKKRKEGGDGT